MRQSTKVLVEDEDTGSARLIELDYFLPRYTVGEEVYYCINEDDNEIGPIEIIGMEISVSFDINQGGYVTETIYRLADDMLVDEDEITQYVDSIDIDVEEEDDI